MKRTIFILVLATLLTIPALAQEPLVEIIFGPRDGDSAGTLYAYENSCIAVDTWMRTAPGVSIIALHIPLSTKDSLVASRDSANYDNSPLFSWDYMVILSPNADDQNEAFTNQSVLGYCCLRPPEYERGIATEGEWRKILIYFMTTVDSPIIDMPFCNAFISGHHPENGGLVLSEYSLGELDPSTYTIQFACLEFLENGCGPYVIGDFNGSGEFNVADIITSYSKLATGSPEPGMICECPPGSGNAWGVAMDVNGSCTFNVADVVIAFHKLVMGYPDLISCPQCPPAGP